MGNNIVIPIRNIVSSYVVILFLQVPLTAVFFINNTVLGTVFFALMDLLILALLVFRMDKKSFSANLIELTPLLFYIAWSFLSVFWTEADSELYSLMLLMKDVLRVLIVVSVLSVMNKKSFFTMFLEAALIASFLFGIIGILTLDYVPQMDGGASRAMYLGYKDSVGVGRPATFLLLLVLVGVFTGELPRIKSLVMVTPCLIVVFLCFSKSSIGALIIALYFVYGFDKRNKRYSLYAFIILFLAGLLVLFFRADYVLNYINAYGGGSATTYTGRTPLWDALSYEIENALFFGHGINSISSLLYKHFYDQGTAHNELLQQLVTLGLVGLSLWSWMHIYYIKKTYRCINVEVKVLMKTLFFFFLIVGLVESVLVTTVFPLYLFALMIMLSSGEWVAKNNENTAYS